MTLTMLGVVTLLGMFLVRAFEQVRRLVRVRSSIRSCFFRWLGLSTPTQQKPQDCSSRHSYFLQTVGMQALGTFHW